MTEQTAFQYCAADGVAAINTGTVGVDERIRWTIPYARKALTVVEKNVYLLSSAQSVLVADLDKGTIKHTVPAPGFTLPISGTQLAALYIAAPDGRIFCAKEEGSPPLLASDVKKAMTRPEPEAESTGAEETATATAGASEQDPLASQRPGSAMGGKSKVSKEYTGD